MPARHEPASSPGVSVTLALAHTAVRAVAPSAAFVLAAVALPSMVVFSPQGLRARDVVTWMEGSLALRAVLWGGWVALLSPVLRLAFDAPGTRTLRSQPVAEGQWVAGALVGALALQGPWVLLFGRGRGAVAGLGAGLVAVALTSALAAGSGGRAALVFAGAALLALGPAPAGGQALLGAALAWLGVRLAWRVAPERGQGAVRLVRATSPWGALLLLYGASLLRTERARLLRALVAVGVGGVLGALAVTNATPAGEAEAARQRLTVGALPLLTATAGVAGPLLASEARLRWVVLSAGHTTRWSWGVVSAAMALFGAVSGGAWGAVLVLLQGSVPGVPALQATSARVVGEGASWGAALGLIALGCVGWGRAPRRGGSHGVLALVAAGAGAMLAAQLDARVALGAMLACAAAVAGRRGS